MARRNKEVAFRLTLAVALGTVAAQQLTLGHQQAPTVVVFLLMPAPVLLKVARYLSCRLTRRPGLAVGWLLLPAMVRPTVAPLT